MRELLTLSIGGFGNRVGAQFIEQLMQEHKIDKQGIVMEENGLQNLDIYFKETSNNQYIPRAIFTDINQDNDPIHLPIDANNIIYGNGTQSNNFAELYYGVGRQMEEILLDSIRSELENCDSFQGFQYLSSLNGGCGSGLSVRLSEQLSDEYPNCVQQHYNLIHQQNNSDIVISPYNNLIALSKIAGLGGNHQIICYDNTSLHGLCLKKIQQKEPVYEDLNQLITMSMLGSTTGIRFPSDQNTDLRKMYINLMPFPSLNFLVPSISAFELDYAFKFIKHNAKNLINNLFDAEFNLCFVTPTKGKYFTNQINFRGDIQQLEVNKYFHKHFHRNSRYYFKWLPDCATFSVNHKRLQNQNMSATMLSNQSSIIGPLQMIEESVKKMLKIKAYTYLFELEGFSYEEIIQCQSNLNDIISIYQNYQDNREDDDEEYMME